MERWFGNIEAGPFANKQKTCLSQFVNKQAVRPQCVTCMSELGGTLPAGQVCISLLLTLAPEYTILTTARQ
jgi:hypothetical protein